MLPMLISSESPLRNLPETLRQRERLILDGVRYTADIAGLAYQRLITTLLQFPNEATADLGSGESTRHVVAFSDVWTFVDTVNRLRVLIHAMPGAPESEPVIAFLEDTGTIRDMRNRIQHLRARVDHLVSNHLPTWGSITWVAVTPTGPHAGYTKMIMAGSTANVESLMENPAGKQVRSPLDHISLHAHGISISITSTWEKVRQLLDFLEGALADQVADLPSAPADMYISVPILRNSGGGQDQTSDRSD